MKRYLLWAGDIYYPSPAMADYKGDFDSIDEARKWVDDSAYKFDWWRVVEHATMKEIAYGGMED